MRSQFLWLSFLQELSGQAVSGQYCFQTCLFRHWWLLSSIIPLNVDIVWNVFIHFILTDSSNLAIIMTEPPLSGWVTNTANEWVETFPFCKEMSACCRQSPALSHPQHSKCLSWFCLAQLSEQQTFSSVSTLNRYTLHHSHTLN